MSEPFAHESLDPKLVKDITMQLDFSDLRTLTLVNGKISAIADKVKNVASFVQATDASRPIRTLGDDRENLVLNSEQMDNAYWFKQNLTIVQNGTAAPDGKVTADALMETVDSGSHRWGISGGPSQLYVLAGQYYRFSLYAKANGRSHCLLIPSGGFAVGDTCFFNLLLGTATLGGNARNASILDVGNGWYRCSFEAMATSTVANASILLYLSTGASTTYAGDITKGLYVWGFQVGANISNPAYVKTEAFPAFPGSPSGRAGAFFDGVDDLLVSTSTLASLFVNNNKHFFAAVRPEHPAATPNRYYFAAGNSRFVGVTRGDAWFFYHYDGNFDTAGTSPVPTFGKTSIFEFKHVGGVAYARREFGPWFSAASGNTDSLAGTLYLGNVANGGANPWRGTMFEFLAFKRALSSIESSKFVRYLGQKWGANVP